jgi:hypothetical protein
MPWDLLKTHSTNLMSFQVLRESISLKFLDSKSSTFRLFIISATMTIVSYEIFQQYSEKDHYCYMIAENYE